MFNDQGIVKLCDFGSSTRAVFHPDDSWSSIQRITLIEEMQRNTTPMYRAPEISDEYMNMPVGPQQDIWALGCVLFYLCYRVHPFEDSAKLRIINAKYTIPADDTTYTMFIPLIRLFSEKYRQSVFRVLPTAKSNGSPNDSRSCGED